MAEWYKAKTLHLLRKRNSWFDSNHTAEHPNPELPQSETHWSKHLGAKSTSILSGNRQGKAKLVHVTKLKKPKKQGHWTPSFIFFPLCAAVVAVGV